MFAFPLPGKITFPLKKSPLFALHPQLPAAALKQYSNGIPRSALTPTTLPWDGTYNEDVAQLFLSSVFIVCFVSTCTYFFPFVFSSFSVFLCLFYCYFFVCTVLTLVLCCTFHSAVCAPTWKEDFLQTDLIQDISIKVFVWKRPHKDGHLSTLEIKKK